MSIVTITITWHAVKCDCCPTQGPAASSEPEARKAAIWNGWHQLVELSDDPEQAATDLCPTCYRKEKANAQPQESANHE